MSANTISSTAKALLTAAAANPDLLIELPESLPTAARRAVAQSMLKTGLAEEITAPAGQPGWRTAETGETVALRATPAGLAAIGGTPDMIAETTLATAVSTQEARTGAMQRSAPYTAIAPTNGRMWLRDAAAAVLAAWDDPAEGRPALPAALDALRSALVQAPRRATGLPRARRTGTKQEVVLALLRRPEGASVAQVAEATGWAPHTVRGFFAGLNKKGIAVAVLERVRQVGSGKQGAKGSYTVYRVAEVG